MTETGYVSAASRPRTTNIKRPTAALGVMEESARVAKPRRGPCYRRRAAPGAVDGEARSQTSALQVQTRTSLQQPGRLEAKRSGLGMGFDDLTNNARRIRHFMRWVQLGRRQILSYLERFLQGDCTQRGGHFVLTQMINWPAVRSFSPCSGPSLGRQCDLREGEPDPDVWEFHDGNPCLWLSQRWRPLNQVPWLLRQRAWLRDDDDIVGQIGQ